MVGMMEKKYIWWGFAENPKTSAFLSLSSRWNTFGGDLTGWKKVFPSTMLDFIISDQAVICGFGGYPDNDSLWNIYEGTHVLIRFLARALENSEENAQKLLARHAMLEQALVPQLSGIEGACSFSEWGWSWFHKCWVIANVTGSCRVVNYRSALAWTSAAYEWMNPSTAFPTVIVILYRLCLSDSLR